MCQGQQKQKGHHASVAEAEGAACKGSRMSNMKEQQNHAEGEEGQMKQYEQHAGATEAEGVACKGIGHKMINMLR